jgi:hypothetical protein
MNSSIFPFVADGQTNGHATQMFGMAALKRHNFINSWPTRVKALFSLLIRILRHRWHIRTQEHVTVPCLLLSGGKVRSVGWMTWQQTTLFLSPPPSRLAYLFPSFLPLIFSSILLIFCFNFPSSSSSVPYFSYSPSTSSHSVPRPFTVQL